MIQMKWRADSENSENSALDTIIVSHKIYEKKYFLIGLTLLLRIEQLNNLLVYLYVVVSFERGRTFEPKPGRTRFWFHFYHLLSCL